MCNKNLKLDDIVRDSSFDQLRNDLKIFKEKNINAFLMKLLSNNQNEITLSPLENVMKGNMILLITLKYHYIIQILLLNLDHFLKSLALHQNYTNHLKNQCEKEIKHIEEQLKENLSLLISKNPDNLKNEKEILIRDAKNKQDILKENLDIQIILIAKHYEK